MNKEYSLITLLLFIFFPIIAFSSDSDIVSHPPHMDEFCKHNPLSCTSTSSPPHVDAKIIEGVTKVSVNEGTSDVITVSVTTIKTPKKYLYDTTSMWSGVVTSPKRIIKSINIFKNKQELFIPISAYIDLADPVSISLEPLLGQRFRLTILGSDAGGAYEATFEFIDDEILSRKVVDREFPDDHGEETYYSFNHLDN
jgi:hypothetical protein